MVLKVFYPAIFGGLIGYLTNWVAIKMLFWPKKPIFFFQGAIPKNKEKIAENIAVTSTDHLFSAEEIASLINQKLTPETIQNVVKDLIPGVTEKLDTDETREEVARLIVSKLKSLISPSFSDGFARGLTQAVSITEFITLNQDRFVKFICDRLHPAVASQAANIIVSMISTEDIQRMIIENVKKMNEDEIETAVYKISRRELTLIEWSGGVLGIIIGLIQMLL